jgi:plastocyanin
MKTRIVAVGLLAAILAGGAFLLCVSRFAVSADEQPSSANIVIDNFSFTPKEITVAKGTTVTWVNHDDVPHTVVSKDQKFRSKALDTNDQFSFTFTEQGTYVYFCSVHPVMIAKVTVK